MRSFHAAMRFIKTMRSPYDGAAHHMVFMRRIMNYAFHAAMRFIKHGLYAVSGSTFPPRIVLGDAQSQLRLSTRTIRSEYANVFLLINSVYGCYTAYAAAVPGAVSTFLSVPAGTY